MTVFSLSLVDKGDGQCPLESGAFLSFVWKQSTPFVWPHDGHCRLGAANWYKYIKVKRHT